MKTGNSGVSGIGSGSSTYGGYLGRASKLGYRNGFAGFKTSPRGLLSNGSDKDSVSGKSRRSKTR